MAFSRAFPEIFHPPFGLGGITWLLRDDFTDTRAAGSVNGTLATPGPGTRTVTDTESKLSIASGALTFAGGKTTATWGDPCVVYPSVSRTAGKILVANINKTDGTTFGPFVGFNTDTTFTNIYNPTAFENYLYMERTSNGIYSYETGAIQLILGSYSVSTEYKMAVVLRSSGAYYFIKGGTQYPNWTLLRVSSLGSTAILYPNVPSFNAVFTADNIRIPTATWLPTPLAYDTFTRADGAIGNSETTGPDSQTTPSLAWTGGAISSNKNVITPTLGDELWDAPAAAFTSGTYAWVAYGTNTIANDTNSLKITYVDNTQGAYNYFRNTSDLSSDLTIGTWYSFNVDEKVDTGNSVSLYVVGNGTDAIILGPYTNTLFNAVLHTFRANSAAEGRVRLSDLGVGESMWLDNPSLKPLTLSSLFSSVSTSDADVIADANVTLTAGTQAGVVLNLDSTSSPANFVIAYHDGTKVYFEKSLAGVYTSLFTAVTTTYVSGATLRVVKDNLDYRVYYNNVLIGTKTLSATTDANIVNNTKHGLFSTYSGNSFDNFTLFARGTGAEYDSYLDKYTV